MAEQDPRGDPPRDLPRDPIEHLVGLLARLPGLGRRSARRAALKMLMHPEKAMLPLAEALRAAAAAVQPCGVCGNLSAPQPLRHLHRCAARPRADLRGRGGRRALGAGARPCASRPLSRAGRHALGARRRRAGGSGGAAAARPHRRGGGAGRGGDPGPARHGGWRDHGALPLGPAAPAAACRSPGWPRACRWAGRSTCWTRAPWPRR